MALATQVAPLPPPFDKLVDTALEGGGSAVTISAPKGGLKPRPCVLHSCFDLVRSSLGLVGWYETPATQMPDALGIFFHGD